MSKKKPLAFMGALISSPLVVIYHKQILAGSLRAAKWQWQWLTTPLPVDGWILVLASLSLVSLLGVVVHQHRYPVLPTSQASVQSNLLGTVDGVTWRIEHGQMVGFCGECDMRLVVNDSSSSLY